ncbi:unnamed protein product [Polarella glacialis]|uniref:Uncharacterized protein n=1 Tax=Polarella glacialis TaxID=89957 RepID=A0A813K2E8_POLGL|nr:unnamed protein product [Polarella glacialis]
MVQQIAEQKEQMMRLNCFRACGVKMRSAEGLPPGGAVGRGSKEWMIQQMAEQKEQMMRPELFSSLRSQSSLCRGPSSRRSRWSGVKRTDGPADSRTERADDEA